MNTLALTLAVLTAVCAFALYALNKRLKPKNIMLAYEPGRGTLQPHIIRSRHGGIKVPVGGGKKVHFPMIPGMGSPRSDGKGQFFMGNVATGQLMRPLGEEGSWQFADGLDVELAFADGRAKQLTNAINGNQELLIKALLIMSALTLIFLVGFIWKFMQG